MQNLKLYTTGLDGTNNAIFFNHLAGGLIEIEIAGAYSIEHVHADLEGIKRIAAWLNAVIAEEAEEREGQCLAK